MDKMEYCPVSSIIRSNVHMVHNYPVDLFDVKSFHRNASLILSQNCFATEDESFKQTHSCFDFIKCPIKLQNVIDFNQPSINSKHSLCSLGYRSIDLVNISRIIILGGSVTQGVGADGCEFPHVDIPNQRDHIANPRCKWSSYLAHWFNTLQKHSTKKAVEIIDLSIRAFSSPLMAKKIFNLLKTNNISVLTDQDIVFIDHSINDARMYSSSTEKTGELLKGLNDLIQRLIFVSKKQKWPTIILLDMWPFTSCDGLAPNQVTSVSCPNEYIFTYQKIAAVYNIPIWSYRNVVWSNYSFSDEMKPYISHLRFQRNIEHSYMHPVWFCHLYYADLIASSLLKEIKQCGNNKNMHQRLTKDMQNPVTLQENVLDIFSALNENHLLFHMNAFEVSKAKYLCNVSFIPSSSWRLSEDVPGKFGWIDEDKDGTNAVCSSSTQKSTKKSKKSYSSSMIINLSLREKILKNQSVILQLEYLKTYLNAGSVDIYLCEKYLDTIDALWNDYHKYHISSNEIFQKKFILKEYCDSRGMIIEIKRLCISTLAPKMHISSMSQYNNARGKQKFKLISIEVL